MPENKDQFYIGWMDKAPSEFKTQLRRFMWTLLILVPLLGAAWVFSERPFSDSVFEFGKLSTIEGIYKAEPVPMLEVYIGKDIEGKPIHRHIMLIGFGKMGALPTIEAIENEQGSNLDGKQVKFRGTLVYHNGQTLLELSEGENALVEIVENTMPKAQGVEALTDLATLRGEVLDAKCYFGVMKPGSGKPHRSCGIRCISGGVPPVFKIQSEEGGVQYFLMLGSEGEPINKKVLDYVADNIQICGRTARLGNWNIVYADMNQDIIRFLPNLSAPEDIPLCGATISQR